MLSLLEQQKFYGSAYWDTYPDDNIHAIILPKEGRSGIYIGNIYAATDTKLHLRYNIKSVLTVQQKCSVKFLGSEQILFHKVIPIDIDNCGDLFKAFYDSYMFIENGISYGNVLIHCQDSVTISPVFVIAYMLQKNGLTIERAWEIVKVQNPFAQVRHQFFQQLLIYEQSLNLDTYLGQPPKEGKHLRNVEVKELSRLEKIREREQNQKTFIESVKQLLNRLRGIKEEICKEQQLKLIYLLNRLNPNHSIVNSLIKQLEHYQFDEPTLPQWPLSSIKQSILSPYFKNAQEIESSNFEFIKKQNGSVSFKVTIPSKTSLKFELRQNFQVILGLGEGKLICKTEHSINEIPLKQTCNIMKAFELINQGKKECKVGIQVC